MKVIVDTNVLISAVLFPEGKVASVFAHIIETHELVVSTYSLRECEGVFTRKFPDKVEQLRNFFTNLSFKKFHTPESYDPLDYPGIRDVKDLPILVSAILSDSDLLITGDKDFEEIRLKRPLIFTPGQYYDLIHK